MTFLNIIAILTLLYGIAGIILSFIVIDKNSSYTKKTDSDYKEPKAILLPFRVYAFAISIIALILLSTIIKIDGQEVGVKITPSGVKENELQPGHWYIVAPWVKIERFDITQWVYTFADPDAVRQEEKIDEDHKEVISDINDVAAPAIWVNTKDQISMKISFSVTWAIDPKSADWIYGNISSNGGDDGRYVWIEQNIIKRVATSAINDIATSYTTSEVYTNKRSEIQNSIFERLKTELGAKHLILISVDIQKAEYNKDYGDKLLATKVAEQEVIRMIQVTKQKEEQLKQASIDKDIAIQTAMGEAEALKIKGTSIAQNPKIIELEWINKWNGELPTYMMGEGKGVMINLNK